MHIYTCVPCNVNLWANDWEGASTIKEDKCLNKMNCTLKLQSKEVTVRDPLLQEREQTHGSYYVQGAWAQRAKEAMRDTPNHRKLHGSQRESLEMIQTKISRILHGSPNDPEHWKDIAGYAKLGEEACK